MLLYAHFCSWCDYILFVCVGVLVYNVSNILLLVFQRVWVYYFFGAIFLDAVFLWLGSILWVVLFLVVV